MKKQNGRLNTTRRVLAGRAILSLGRFNMHTFPKIFTVGTRFIGELFNGEVEITEKVDGSFFAFGRDGEGKFHMRSKGQEVFAGHAGMFSAGAEYLTEVVANSPHLISPGYTIYGEYLGKPKHNVLSYERTPNGHIIVFAVYSDKLGWINNHETVTLIAAQFGLETVPLLFKGHAEVLLGVPSQISDLLQTPSILGKETVEGIVIKNYGQTVVIGGHVMPQFGKLVRAEFKERHEKNWKGEHTDKGAFEIWLEGFRAEARWQKAVQHMTDAGLLVGEAKDIGPLMKELERDLFDEETQNIKDELFELFKKQIGRKAKAGMAEWYKAKLASEVVLSVMSIHDLEQIIVVSE